MFMKLGFITCVQLGLSCMKSIYEVGGELSLAITLPDNKAINKSGRVFLDEFCSYHKIPLLKSDHINNNSVINAIKEAHIDWLFIIGWSQIAGSDILAAPKFGVLGMHPTLLPEGRGRASIPWAILKCLQQTGVTLFKLDSGIDTGSIAAQIVVPLTSQTTAADLYNDINQAHCLLMKKAISDILSGTLILKKQDETKASVWPGRKPQDGEINPCGSVWDAERLVRALTRPYPGAFYFDGGKKIVVWKSFVVNKPPKEDVHFIRFYDGFLVLEQTEQSSISGY